MGLKVIGIDISDVQLETAKKSGADHVFNSMADKDYVKKILELTGGGVDAAVNFTASKKVSHIPSSSFLAEVDTTDRRTTMLLSS